MEIIDRNITLKYAVVQNCVRENTIYNFFVTNIMF